MQALHQVLGFSEEQRLEFLRLVAETITDNAATDLIETISETDRQSLAEAIKNSGDINATVAQWAIVRFANDPKAAEVLKASVNRSLDAVTDQLWEGMDNSQRQKLSTMNA